MARPKGSTNRVKKETMDRQVAVRLPDDLVRELETEAAQIGVNKLSTFIRMILVTRSDARRKL